MKGDDKLREETERKLMNAGDDRSAPSAAARPPPGCLHRISLERRRFVLAEAAWHHAERPLALTLGDPAGIGPDITLLAWLARAAEADSALRAAWAILTVLAARADALGLAVPIATIAEAEAAEGRFAEELPVLPVTVAGPVVPGRPDEAAAPAVQHSIERAVRLVLDGEARAIVTNPISKAVLYRGGLRLSRSYRISRRPRRFGRGRLPTR